MAGGRILFFSGGAHHALNPEATRASGGAELQVALLAGELARRGVGVSIAAAGGGFPDGVTWNGVRVRDAGKFDRSAMMEILGAWPQVFRVLREENPDWVVVYGWTAWLAVLVMLGKCSGFRVAFVCALDGELDGSFRTGFALRKRLFQWGMRNASARFGITQAQLDGFTKLGMEARLTRLLLADEMGDHAARPVPADKPVDLLWVARCHPVKRPGLFLNLAAEFPSARCRMICSPQDADLHAKVREQAARLDNVEFLDGVPYREIQSHFDAARIFVNTSRDEGVPNTFLHAAVGGAAIASLEVDPDGCIRTFGAGCVANGRPEVLAEGIRKLLQQPAAWRSASVGVRSFIAAWHDNARNVDAFLEGLR
ncbi:MAG: hypothetical protein Fur0032_22960 [Terrimicrobiaceae bacterium]